MESAVRESQIPRAIGDLEHAIERLDKEVARLNERLERAMRPGGKDTSELNKIPGLKEDPLCGLAQQIQDRTRHLACITEKVAEFVRLLEL